jgi:hypothetical protein
MIVIILWISLVGVVPLKAAYDWVADRFEGHLEVRPSGRGIEGVASLVTVGNLAGGTRPR